MRTMNQEIMQGLQRLVKKYYGGNRAALARHAEVPNSIISKYMAGTASPRMDTITKLLDAVGARIVWPDEEGSTQAIDLFVDGDRARTRPNHVALPLVSSRQARRLGREPISNLREDWLVVYAPPGSLLAVSRNVVAIRIDDPVPRMAHTRVREGSVVCVDLDDQTPGDIEHFYVIRSEAGIDGGHVAYHGRLATLFGPQSLSPLIFDLDKKPIQDHVVGRAIVGIAPF